MMADGIQLVHVHQSSAAFIGSAVGAVLGLPVLLTVHGLSHERIGLIERTRLWMANRGLAGVTAVSDAARVSYARAVRLATDRIAVVANGLDYDPGGMSDAPGTPHWIGIAGNLTPVKGHSVLIQATRDVVDRLPDARLIVVGDGPEREELERLARELGLSVNVEFWGRYEGSRDRRYIEFLRRIQLLVLPSFSEACPMVALEAMAAGKPIVASRVGGIPEIVRDGITGSLVPPGDAQALAAGIVALLCDDSLRAQMSRQARQDFDHRFAADLMMSRFEQLYRPLWAMPPADG
jgi:glycosyltransferase involved in cell wall biosynthesis